MIRAEKRLNLPLPEMTFGNNSLLCTYNDGSNEVTMRFNGIEALSEVGVGEGWEDRVGGGVLVSMAESWGKNRYVQRPGPLFHSSFMMPLHWALAGPMGGRKG